MAILNLLLTIIITISPPSDFVCDGSNLHATIYNNLNGDYKIAADMSKLDEGAFAVLKWKELNIMIPRTFNSGEISFSDRKWWWSYQDNEHPLDLDHPRLRRRSSNGKVVDYTCKNADFKASPE